MGQSKRVPLALAAAAVVAIVLAGAFAVPRLREGTGTSGDAPAGAAGPSSAMRPAGDPGALPHDVPPSVRTGPALVSHGTTAGPSVPVATPSPAAGGPSAAGEPRAAAAPVPDSGLRLRVLLHDRDAAEGGPIRARVSVVNAGRTPVELCDPQVDLARRIEVLYRWGDAGHVAAAPRGAMEPLDASKVVRLAPGESVDVEMNLRPLLDRAVGFGEGPFVFSLAYRGDPAAMPAVVRAWNGDAERIATSAEVVVESAVPAWFEKLGGDREILHGVPARVRAWTPGGPDDAVVEAHVRALGDPAFAALAVAAERMGSRTPGAEGRSSRCLAMLRRLGADALPALRQVPAGPAVAMAIAVIEEDERERSHRGASAESGPFRSIGGGEGRGTSFLATLSKPDGAVTFTLDAAGTLFVTVREGSAGGAGGGSASGSADAQGTTAPPLTTDQSIALKRAILRARPWTWKAVREERRGAEGDASFALADGRGAVQWSLTLRGDEARVGNPFAADLVRALESAADASREVTSAPGTTAPGTPSAAPSNDSGR